MREFDLAKRATERLPALFTAELSAPKRYLVAVALTALALGLRLWLGPVNLGRPFITFFPAAALAAIIGGLGPGLLVAGLSAVLAVWLFLPPGQFGAWSVFIYLADEVLVCSAIEAMHRYYRHYSKAVSEMQAARDAADEARRTAENANAAKTVFLAATSHDLRQPFQAMRLFHEVLREKAGPELSPIVDHLGKAISSGEELLSAFLDLSVLDAGTIEVRKTVFPVDLVLAEVADDCGSMAEAANLRLRRVRSTAVVFSDRVLLRRIVRNLLVNAIRYTPEGGILIGCRRRDGKLIIQVADTGIGISRDKLDLVFNDFYQIGNQARDKSQGLGLGLAIVSRLGRLLGHSVSVASKLDKGSIFSVEVELMGCDATSAKPTVLSRS